MSILITGGSGLVGQNLTAYLVNKGYKNIRVHLHSRKPRIMYPEVEYVYGNLTKYEDCLEVTKNIDVVVHAAASTSNAVDTVSDPLAHVTPNVAMNNFLIDASYRNEVKKYVFISSNTVYPKNNDEPVYEYDYLYGSIYPAYYPVGWMKRYAEIQCDLYSNYLTKKMITVIVRPANLYGPHDKFDFAKCHVTPASIRKVADNLNPIPVWGDGQELRDLLYIDDFIEALELIIDKQETYDVFNIGSNQVYSVLDVLNTMKTLVGNTNEIEFISGKPSMIPVRRINSDKVRTTFDWKPKVTLEEGLLRTYNWYCEHKEEFTK